MRRAVVTKWTLGVAALLLLSACQSASQGERSPPLVRVETVAAVDHQEQLLLTGAVEAKAETPQAFRVGGQLTVIAVDVGARVKAGDLLAKLAPEEQQADVDAARAALTASQSQLAQAKATLDRQNALWTQGLTTRSSLDGAQAAFDTATSATASATAQLQTAEEALGYTELRASADGQITRRLFEAGEVAPAGSPVLILAEDGPRNAVFNLPESALIDRSPDQAVEVALVSNPEVKATGKVAEIAPALDPQTGTIEVKVAIDAPAEMVLGAPVIGTTGSLPHKRVILPWSALWSSDGKAAVWVVGADSSVAIAPVEVAEYATGSVVIAGGLSDGQVVVTEGGKLLTPGQRVETVAGSAP